MTTSPSEAVSRLRATVAKYQVDQAWRQSIVAERGLAAGGFVVSTNQQLEDTAVLLSLLDEARRVVEPFARAAIDVDEVDANRSCADDVPISDASYETVTVGDCRAAAAFLEKLGSET